MKRTYWWIAGIIIIVAIVVYAIAHHSSYNSNKNSSSYSSSNGSNKPASTKADIITTKTSPSLGKYLADGSGRTLYTYDQDKPKVSNVSGSLLGTWPAYTATSSSASLPANVGTITRSDGTVQYTYNDMPLYYFAGEPAGQVTGDDVSGFHVAKATTQTQTQTQSSSTPSSTSGGSGYSSPY
jgi:predicted lipoprotein with Yx(FWY)xxD motif